MVYVLLFVIILTLTVIFRKYKTIYSAAGAIIFLMSITTLVFLYGLFQYNANSYVDFLGRNLPKQVFTHLIAGWYLMNAASSFLIIRKFMDYKKVNSIK
ncbi:MAG: hypothetical protein GY754_43210 [bacterium]|nr:hypothetical protein [bacterium]